MLKYRPVGGDRVTEHPVGNLDGLAVYLNRTALPEKVWRDNRAGEVIDALGDALGGNGALVFSHWTGPKEIALHFYGEGGREAMLEKAVPVLNTHPLCEKCRIVWLT